MLLGNLVALALLLGSQSAENVASPQNVETTPPNSPQIEQNQPRESKDDVVCRKVHVTGYRVGKKKICYTRAEWELIEAETEDNLRRRTMMEGDVRVSGRTKP